MYDHTHNEGTRARARGRASLPDRTMRRLSATELGRRMSASNLRFMRSFNHVTERDRERLRFQPGPHFDVPYDVEDVSPWAASFNRHWASAGASGGCPTTDSTSTQAQIIRHSRLTIALPLARDARALGRLLRALAATMPADAPGVQRAALCAAADLARGGAHPPPAATIAAASNERASFAEALALAASTLAAHGRVGVRRRVLWRRGRNLDAELTCQTGHPNDYPTASATTAIAHVRESSSHNSSYVEVTFRAAHRVVWGAAARDAQARLVQALKASWATLSIDPVVEKPR